MSKPWPGKLFQQGSTDPEVLDIQKALGFGPGGQTGIFGPTTEEAVCAFQLGRGLDVDGIVGKDTWNALFAAQPSADLGLKALAEAITHVGQQEQPLGSNRGPFVNQCNEEIGVALGSFWCMSFVQKCVKDAANKLGVTVPIKRTASCSQLFQWARSNGRLVARPEVGDIFLCIGGESGHFHCGFVAGPIGADNRFETIEGNSNEDGSANGTKVARRRPGRRLSTCHYVRL